MNAESRVSVRWPVLVLAAVVLIGLGAGAAYLGLRPAASPQSGDRAGTTQTPSSPEPAPESAATSAPDVVVTLAPEAVKRAGITVVAVAQGNGAEGLRAPGVVEANAYKQVAVTPLVSGRVTSVSAELGQHVQRGQTIAQISSTELAEAQTRYISARADLEAHEQELARTERLVAIGGASRQELERVHAGHTARRADLESAASRLELLGLSRETITGLGPGKTQGATVNVPAPISGVVTERLANLGLNVDQATKLFTVVDLSSVWVVANLYEKDFSRVRVGSPATITTTAYPDSVFQGRVSYIDPQVNPETRTAKARVEVPNPRGDLRLGMYAEALFASTGGGAGLMMPRAAVQTVGDRTVVYLTTGDEPGRFIEREVRLGPVTGEHVLVESGVQEGDLVVAEGSFSVRAERDRLGLPRSGSGQAPTPPATGSGPASQQANRDVQEVKVAVTDAGFEPQRITLRAGVPARVTFTRTSDKTCATAVVFASLNIRRDLPLNTPVAVEFTPSKTGEIPFACGMNMLKGTVVVP